MIREDINTAPTVGEYLKMHDYAKIWVCPHIVNSGSINIDPILKGIECTASTIPDPILSKKVWGHFNDGKFHCIIWYNDETVTDYHFWKRGRDEEEIPIQVAEAEESLNANGADHEED